MKILLNIILLLSLILLYSCNSSTHKEIVFVSILPQKFIVEKIAGNKLKVEAMVKNGMSPATYEPLPGQMLNVSRSSIYFFIGVPFEFHWLERLKENYPDVSFVNAANGIKLKPMQNSSEIFNNSNNNSHSHEGIMDPHIWLSPPLVKTIGKNILKALIKQYPNDSSYFNTNFKKFSAEIDSFDNRIRNMLSGIKNRSFMVFHPSWGYFAKTYNLKQIPIEIEGKEPGIKELSGIIQLAKKENIKAIFVQKQFSTHSAETISASTGAKVLQIDPVAENYFESLEEAARLIKENSN